MPYWQFEKNCFITVLEQAHFLKIISDNEVWLEAYTQAQAE